MYINEGIVVKSKRAKKILVKRKTAVSTQGGRWGGGGEWLAREYSQTPGAKPRDQSTTGRVYKPRCGER